mmetsp:Transcript_2446/g.2732  ORF Transcript_2446/g.2732 Transcript_2446/m.2732 type:complete len:171 (+) Transcript_2446:1-513(+)
MEQVIDGVDTANIPVVSVPDLEKQEWARRMRIKFSPKDMVDEKGQFKPEYFKPNPFSVEERKWTNVEKDHLISGIAKYGIGNWNDIRAEFLPLWTPAELRVKTQRLIGKQSLKWYIDQRWKGKKWHIGNEFRLNKALGTETGCWKNGMLVKDGEGVVERMFLEKRDKSKK